MNTIVHTHTHTHTLDGKLPEMHINELSGFVPPKSPLIFRLIHIYLSYKIYAQQRPKHASPKMHYIAK